MGARSSPLLLVRRRTRMRLDGRGVSLIVMSLSIKTLSIKTLSTTTLTITTLTTTTLITMAITTMTIITITKTSGKITRDVRNTSRTTSWTGILSAARVDESPVSGSSFSHQHFLSLFLSSF